MQRYIAFLRAINVGGHNVKMDLLRTHFEALGLANVATFIASGNVIFEAAEDARALETQIERHLRQALGYDVATFIRSAPELAAIAAYRPFPAADLAAEGGTLYVAFLPEAPPEAVQSRLLALRTPTDDFHFHGRELFWLVGTRLSESPLFNGGSVEKTLGMPMTMRNISTVNKIVDKYAAPD